MFIATQQMVIPSDVHFLQKNSDVVSVCRKHKFCKKFFALYPFYSFSVFH